MLLPIEILDRIFYYAKDVKTILPFQNYMYTETIQYILKDIKKQILVKKNCILIIKILIKNEIEFNWNSTGEKNRINRKDRLYTYDFFNRLHRIQGTYC